MIRYCSSIALIAVFASACASKKVDDGAGAATGGGGYQFGSGGGSSTGGAGGAAPITATSGFADITPEDQAKLTDSACFGWSSEGENSPALIDFVVDTSGSMAVPAPNTTDGRSKWEITAEALQNAINSLPRMTRVGMLLWPNMPTIPNHNDLTGTPLEVQACVNTGRMVPIGALDALGSPQRSALSDALSAVDPAGGTPMADAYNYALEYGMAASPLLGARYMVLITDGQPTIQLGCMGTGEEARPVDFTPVTQSIDAAWNKLKTKTFVIGSPGSENQSSTGADGRGLLSAAARAGNTAAAGCSDTGPVYCHFDMSTASDFAAGFTSALQNITGQVLSCDFKISSIPSGSIVDQNKLNVVYKINGSSDLGQMKLVLPSADSSCPQGNGWYLDPDDSTHVILCGNTCDLIHQDAGAVLSFTGGCAPISLIN